MIGKKPEHRRKIFRIAKILAIIFLAFVLLLFASTWYIAWLCTAVPPKLTTTPAILGKTVIKDENVSRIENCWLTRKDNLYRMCLTGDPFTLGYANAALTQDLIKEQEQNLLDTVRQFVPSKINLWLLKRYVFLRNKNLPSFVKEEYQVEIYGLSRGYQDPFPEIAPLYHRLLNYHAAHDISHAVMDNPLVGCTSFAAWGKHTKNGHLLLGRNFDFSAGRCFDANKIVCRVKPDKGIGYISVSWAGMIGVVSGINDQHIAVTINAARSSSSPTIGTPASLVMREIMQNASALEEAIRIIQESQVFVADCYLIADGKTGKAVVVEKTPRATAVRNAEGEYIICANHLLTNELKNDEANQKYMREGTSVLRYERMKELVCQNAGALDAARIAEVLRDREVKGVSKPGLGNAAAINPLIATHSVIIDVTDGIIWVSVSPHQLGKFIPFTLDNFDSASGITIIPEDPILNNGSYDRFVKSSELITKAQALLKEKRREEAKLLLEQAAYLSPDYYLPYMLLGKIEFEKGNSSKARELLEKSLEHYPSYESERKQIENTISDIRSKLEK